MKKVFSLLFVLLFSIAAVISYKRSRACGGGDWEYEWQSIFTPEVTTMDSTLSPMFYETYYSTYSSYSDWYWKQDQAMIEWKEYFKGEIPEEAIRFYLFSNTGEKEFASIAGGAKSSVSYPKLDWTTPKMREFKAFLKLAKKVDQASDGRNFSWGYEPQKKQVYTGDVLIDELTKHYRESTNEIMKLKWWFQVVKAKYYSANSTSLIAFMQETSSSVPHGTYYYRALNYLGGVYYRQRNFPTANAYYAQVMAACPQLRFDALLSYHGLSENDFQYALNLLSTPAEKAAMWAMQGYYTGNDLEAMQAIYAIDSKSELLDVMLSRSINRMENVMGYSDQTSYRNYVSDVAAAVDKDLVKWVVMVAQEGKVRDREVWNLAAAYLNALTGENKLAETELASVFEHGSAIEIDQAHVLSLVNEVIRVAHEDKEFYSFYNRERAAEFESRVYPHLNWLFAQGDEMTYASYSYWNSDSKTTTVRVQYAYAWVKHIMSLMYTYDIRGELLNPDPSYYHELQNISEMKRMMKDQSGNSNFDRLLLSEYPIKLEDIELYEGLVLVYSGQLERGKAHFQKTELANETLMANPFEAGIQDCHDCDFAQFKGTPWTRMTTLNRMIKLNNDLERGVDKYQSALSLGNAYYNLSYYGNSRAFYESKLMYSWGNYVDDFHGKFLNSTLKAMSYYRIALDNARNDEERAKCEYFMAKCERNEFYNFGWVSDEMDFLAWNGFANLKSNYSNTQFYRDVIRECGYFRTYVEKKN